MNLDWGHGRLPPPDLPPDPGLASRDSLADFDAIGRLVGTPPPDRVDNVWYLPGRRLQVVYSWTAHAMPPLLVRHVAGARAEICWLPHDPTLSAVRDVVGFWSDRWRLLSWLPGVRVTLLDRRSHEVVKVAEVSTTSASVAVGQQLWTTPDRGFRMPEPRPGYVSRGERREAWVPGRPLDPAGALAPEALSDVVEATAALHATPVSDLPQASTDRLVRLVSGAVTARLQRVLPESAATAARVGAALGARVPDATPHRAVTLHGDLHPANLRLDGHGVVLLDLDGPVRGDPADDLALFAGRLVLAALVRGADPAAAITAARELPDRYAEARHGHGIPPATYAWYVAAHLAGRHARTAVRHWAPGVASIVPAVLAAAEATLSAGRPSI